LKSTTYDSDESKLGMFPSMFPSFLLQYVISHANIYFMLNSGVDRLVDNQSYTAAYPLHEVSKLRIQFGNRI
jgi:hypothetical protein